MKPPDGLQLDLATALARIKQAGDEPEMAEFLLWRLVTCDLPRLQGYLSSDTTEWLDSFGYQDWSTQNERSDDSGDRRSRIRGIARRFWRRRTVRQERTEAGGRSGAGRERDGTARR